MAKIKVHCDNCNDLFEIEASELEKTSPTDGPVLPFCSEKCRREFVKVWNAHAKDME